MKKLCSIALVLVLTVCLMAGCRGRNTGDTSTPSTTSAPTTQMTTAPTSAPTTQPTTQATTTPTTGMTGPDMEDVLPGTGDTVDPTSGANQDTQGRSRSIPRY